MLDSSKRRSLMRAKQVTVKNKLKEAVIDYCCLVGAGFDSCFSSCDIGNFPWSPSCSLFTESGKPMLELGILFCDEFSAMYFKLGHPRNLKIYQPRNQKFISLG